MKIGKNIIVVSATFCLTAVLFTTILTRSANTNYNPWLDVNDDGKINILDITAVAKAFLSTGDPYEGKAAIEYDSGWINITDLRGKYINLTYGLNVNWSDPNLLFDIVGTKTFPTGLNELNRLIQSIPRNQSFGWGPKEYGDACAECVIQTKDGGYAVAGFTHEGLPPYNVDFYLLKTDMWGNKEWEKTYGTPGEDYAWSVIQLDDEGFLLAGYTIPISNQTSSRAHLVRTDKNGDVGGVGTWEKTYETDYDTAAFSVVKAWNGGYIFAGHGQFLWRPRFYWVEIDEAGNVLGEYPDLWGYGDDYEWGRCIIRTNDGGYAIAGTVGGDHCQLIKIGSRQNIQWRYRGRSNQQFTTSTECYSVVQIDDNTYMMAGQTKVENPYVPYNWDFCTVKVVKSESDDEPNGYWRTYCLGDTDYSNEYDEKAFSIAKSRFGGCAIGGVSSRSGGSALMIKTDDAGVQEWYYNFVDGGISSIIETEDGGFAMTGNRGLKVFLDKLSRFYTPPEAITVVGGVGAILVVYRNIADTEWNYVRIRILRLG